MTSDELLTVADKYDQDIRFALTETSAVIKFMAARIEELERDAKRYSFLEDCAVESMPNGRRLWLMDFEGYGDSLGDAIDHAIDRKKMEAE